MDSIDVKGLPESLARAVESLVIAWRLRFAEQNGEPQPPAALPEWKGKAVGSLSRDEIYREIG